MLCFYFQQKNRIDFNMGAIIRKKRIHFSDQWKGESIKNKPFTPLKS